MALPVLNTATYEMKIPSTGEKVEFRPFTVKEEKVLLTVLESNDMTLISRTLRNLINTCTLGKVQAEDLAMFDIEYVFLKIRAKSVGEKTTLGLLCKNKDCNEKNEYVINLDTIELSGRGISPKEKIQLTDQVGIIMRYPRVSDTETYLKHYASESNTGMDLLMGIMAASIEAIYDSEAVYPAKDHKVEEIADFLESLNGDQFKKVQEFFADFPKLAKDVNFDCVKCGTHNEYTLEGLSDFFG